MRKSPLNRRGFLFCGSQYAFVKEGSLPTGNVFVWLAFLKGLALFFFFDKFCVWAKFIKKCIRQIKAVLKAF